MHLKSIKNRPAIKHKDAPYLLYVSPRFKAQFDGAEYLTDNPGSRVYNLLPNIKFSVYMNSELCGSGAYTLEDALVLAIAARGRNNCNKVQIDAYDETKPIFRPYYEGDEE